MLTCGVDEAGRGCLAGVVVAAAVVFGGDATSGLRDSKKLSAATRVRLAAQIRDDSTAYAIGVATVDEINRYNIRQATMFAMQRAVSGIVVCPDMVQVDGDFVPDLPYPAEAICGGDDLLPAIMAASILAKVYRDQLMLELDKEYPQYGFAEHKGYPTFRHVKALQQHGATSHHRIHFAPVRKVLEERREDKK